MVYFNGENLKQLQWEMYKNLFGEWVVILQLMEEQLGRKKKEYVHILEKWRLIHSLMWPKLGLER